MTLGVPQVPDGNYVDAVAYLRNKSDEWADKVRIGHLLKKEAWLCMNITIIRSLVWPLPALCISEKDCKHILTPVLLSGLPASGICCTIHRNIVHGPTNEHGLDISNLHVYQGSQHIQYYVNHIQDKNYILGKLLRTSSEQTKVEIGTGEPLFNLTYKPI